jgi:type IV pilus assembly protein PilB
MLPRRRLADACGQPLLAARTLTLVVAQRLIRRACVNCKVEITDMPAKTLIELGVPPYEVGTFKVYRGKGCSACNGTGYKGRIGLFEVMEISDGIRDLMMVQAMGGEMRRKALEEGMLTLRMSGVEKIKAGITTVEEVLRETTL